MKKKNIIILLFLLHFSIFIQILLLFVRINTQNSQSRELSPEPKSREIAFPIVGRAPTHRGIEVFRTNLTRYCELKIYWDGDRRTYGQTDRRWRHTSNRVQHPSGTYGNVIKYF